MWDDTSNSVIPMNSSIAFEWWRKSRAVFTAHQIIQQATPKQTWTSRTQIQDSDKMEMSGSRLMHVWPSNSDLIRAQSNRQRTGSWKLEKYGWVCKEEEKMQTKTGSACLSSPSHPERCAIAITTTRCTHSRFSHTSTHARGATE